MSFEKQPNKILLFIRSLFFIIVSTILVIIFSMLVIAASPFSLSRRYQFVRGYLYTNLFLLKNICGVSYVIEGLENIPHASAGVIMCKHQSTWETFFLPLIFKDPAIILKRELLFVPFFGWAFAVLECIAIDRSQRGTAMQQIIEKGERCLQKGRWVLFFPEGTRIPYGEVGQYKLGGARLAAATGYPIVPIAHNAGRYWPKRSIIKYPGTIRVVIGPAIPSQGRAPEALLNEVKTWIEDTVKKIG